MGSILEKLGSAFVVGLILMALVLFGFHGPAVGDNAIAFGQAVTRYVHVFLGILWIGLLYYFNFVQIPTMPKVPAELKPGVSKYIAPAALFWFRWAAAGTVAVGLILAMHMGYLVESLTLQPGFALIGVGMWLGIIMAFNVWFIIWPNQKKALGLVEADADTKAKAAPRALYASRFNTMFSIGMLYCMVAQQNAPI